MDINKIWHKLTPSERAEVERLLNTPTLPDLLRDAFPLQRQFILDESKLKILFCTRRSAKSYSGALALCRTALARPQTSSVFIGLTRDSTKRIVWTDCFKAILEKHAIDCKYNETELTITFPNKSIIYCVGVDDSEAEQSKLLGKKWAGVVIDEAASYSIDLRSLVYKTLLPACSDLGGYILMVGTPSDRKAGLFYDLTADLGTAPATVANRREGWTRYAWTANDNPYMREQWQQTIRDLEASTPHLDEQAWFKQMYLAQWVSIDENKIYRYNRERNAFDGVLPDYGWTPWQYVLGIDLGFNDATALSLLAYHQNDPYVYIIKADKWKGLTITDTANKIREWLNLYPIGYMTVDGASKQAVQELCQVHQLPLQPADKTDKVNFIRMMNSDFVSGRIKMHRDQCILLEEEYDKLIWDRRALERGLYKEDTSFHGDLSDSTLYAYRHCYHYVSVPVDPKEIEEYTRRQTWDAETRATMERIEQEIEQKKMDRWGSEWLYD